MKNGSYWYDKGCYQNILNKLTKQHMKPQGSSDTVFGEIVRALNRLTYEYYNNGNCNAYLGKWESRGNESRVSTYYNQFLTLIEQTIPDSGILVTRVRNVIRRCVKDEEKEKLRYTKLTDHCISYIMRNKGKDTTDFPYWYDKD